MAIIDHFPKNFTPLAQQTEILEQIETAYKEGYKYVICCAPTGSGKSFIPKTLANSSKSPSARFVQLIESNEAFDMSQGGGYVNEEECMKQPKFGAFALTITKTLQDQYKYLFNDSEILKGKSNYQCMVDDQYTVDIAPCIFLPKLKDECMECNKCVYYNIRKDMLINKFSILNYSMFLSLPDHVKQREYMICDEASELEDEIVKRFSRLINKKIIAKINCDKSPPIHDYSKFYIWLQGFAIALLDEVASIEKQLKKKTKEITVAERQRLMLFKSLQHSLELTLNTWKECEYIVEMVDDGIKLTPLKINTLANHIFEHAEKVLLMSATIIDPANFAKTLGIEKYKYIEVDSTFSPKKAPIFATTKIKLNYKNLTSHLPFIAKQIGEIVAKHKGEKGIIHTHTGAITSFLQDNLRGNRYLFRVTGSTNADILGEHIKSTEDTVLVSPSLTFGVDLKDNLARFQIIVKAPWMPLGDERVKRLFNEDGVWYQNKMLSHVIQACGRGIRTKDDHCVTYILDGTITDSILKNKSKLPKYFLNRFN